MPVAGACVLRVAAKRSCSLPPDARALCVRQLAPDVLMQDLVSFAAASVRAEHV